MITFNQLTNKIIDKAYNKFISERNNKMKIKIIDTNDFDFNDDFEVEALIELKEKLKKYNDRFIKWNVSYILEFKDDYIEITLYNSYME